MAKEEIINSLATERIVNAIKDIRASQIPEAVRVLDACYEAVNEGQLDYALVDGGIEFPTVTAFRPLRSLDGKFKPRILFNPSEVLFFGKDKLGADLVRTLSVASQYPTQGYQRRMSDVYEDALNLQARYLDKREMGSVPFDPRVENRGEVRREVLGDIRFFYDCGFVDFQRALGSMHYETEQDRDNEERVSLSLFQSPESFVIAREYTLTHIFDPLTISFFEMGDAQRLRQDAAAITAGQAIVLMQTGLLS